MSLDVYLEVPTTKPVCVCSNICPCHAEESDTETIFSTNITHNLGKMAGEAGLYEALWRPDENGMETAAQLIESLTKGIELLEADPERFKKFNPENGWGDYDCLLQFTREYLVACCENPTANVRASR